MPDFNAVLKHVSDYSTEQISLDDFEDRFRDDSRGAWSLEGFGNLCAAIESALSDYHFGPGVDEPLLRKELALLIGNSPVTPLLPRPESRRSSEKSVF
jgi:hypothetical protein